VVEALARSGIGTIGIVDYEVVDVTNINRQIAALNSTVGEYKADVFLKRISDINESIKVRAFKEKLTPDSIDMFFSEEYDYIVDAIDDTQAKVALIEKSKELGIPVISSMGTGNKLDPSRFIISDIQKTHTCPLAKKIRKELMAKNIRTVKVVFSDEPPIKPHGNSGYPASIAFVPAAAGILIAGEVVRDLIFKNFHVG
jgi:tRNA A37 threonylcarbamoyladenosine dehydratase